MKLGVLSDTHGHVARTQRACELLLAHAPGAVLHCGDLGSEDMLIELAAAFDPSSTPVHAVLGNVDLYQASDYLAFPETTCVRVTTTADLELEGKRIAVIHGHDRRFFDDAIFSGMYDYIFTGHTHLRSDETIGTTRVINPGAVYRSAEPGCAVFDTDTGALTYLDL